VAAACAKLLAAARILGVPAIVSEQYPKGLGRSAPELGLEDEARIEKTVFSAARAEGFELYGREQALVCGIEAHVCVGQTVHDLLDRGVEVHVPADAVGSRHKVDYERALERLQRAGAVVSTVEGSLFELLERAGTPEFKEVQKLIL
jgi:3-oxoacyl-ACP reductase-like protein